MQSNLAARSFLAFLLMLLTGMLFAALASPWVLHLLGPETRIPLNRVFDRLMLLGLIILVAWWIFRHRDRRELLGLNRPLPILLQRALIGLIAGLALMAVVLMPLAWLELRQWNTLFPTHLAGWVAWGVKALASGIAVALIEETLFRGAMQGALQRLGAMRWALFAVPLLYSAVHFLGRGMRVPLEEVNASSGFVVWQGLFHEFAHPLRILDAFVALYCVGLLLALVRQRWGDIAGCMGLHAGFVAVIAVFRKISAPATGNEWSFLIGSFDGLLGIWVTAVTALLCLILWHSPRK